MNLSLAQHIESLGPGPEADQLMHDYQPDSFFITGNSPETELESLAGLIREFADTEIQLEGGEGMLYSRAVDFAETSLHVVVNAVYRRGQVRGLYSVPRSTRATWRSDKYPEGKPLANEGVYVYGGGRVPSRIKRRVIVADAPKLRESIAVAQLGH